MTERLPNRRQMRREEVRRKRGGDGDRRMGKPAKVYIIYVIL